jgi:L-ascorbate metabolism protein UlaG (beta-lactamase superfamily)
MKTNFLKKRNLFLIITTLALIKLFLMFNPTYFTGESPNFKNGKFWNSFDATGLVRENREKNLFFKWQKERWQNDVSWKKEDIEKFAIYKPYEKLEQAENLSIVFVGHATFLIQMHGVNILTDPIWSERASPVSFAGPKRHTKPGINFDELPKVDYVLISHSHYDHLDIPTIKKLKKAFNPVFITGLGNCYFLNKRKKLNIQCEEKDWGEFLEVKPGFRIFFEKAKHWAKRTLFDSNQTLWGSFVIKSEKYNIFFSGDTGLANHFEMIREEYGAFDVSLLGIGAYKPKYIMQYSHLSPEDAVKAHIDLHSRQSFGMHLKTFQLSDETFNEPVEDLETEKQKVKIPSESFTVLDFGERRNF